ncbi:MAG: phosphatase PAP2 family protein [Actinomycetota bacterium]
MRARPFRAATFAAAALAIGVWSSRERGRELDAKAFHALNGGHTPGRDRFFSGVTELGSIWASIGAAAALAVNGRTRTATRALLAALATWSLGQVLKKSFLRPRPYHAHADTARVVISRPQGTSWPSSHPAVITAFLTVAARDLDLSLPIRAMMASPAAAVGVSRIYLGVHFPSDVAGGLLLGRAVGIAWPAES